MSCQFDLESLGQLREDYFNPANLMEREIPVKDLKSCPFCGNKEVVYIGSDDIESVWVECWKCHTQSDTYPTEADARDAWNRRAE